MRSYSIASLAIVVCACGGGQSQTNRENVGVVRAVDTFESDGGMDAATGSSESESGDDGLVVEGQLGTISGERVAATINESDAVTRCFSADVSHVPQLAYASVEVGLVLRIGTDGRPVWVHIESSNSGSRDVETCLIGAVSGMSFVRPIGGEAEVRHTLAVTGSGRRPPTDWDAARAAPAIARDRRAYSACGTSTYSVTVIVGRGGRALAAGGATADRSNAETVACITDVARRGTYPDPGSFPARVTFTVP